MKNWPDTQCECFDNVAAALRTEVQEEAEEHFGRFPALKKFMRSVQLFVCVGSRIMRPKHIALCVHDRSKLDTQLDAYVSTASPIVQNTLKSESDPYGTQNLRDLNLMRDLWRVQYKTAAAHTTHLSYLDRHSTYAARVSWVRGARPLITKQL